MSEFVWVSGDRRIPLGRMTSEHLINALNRLERDGRRSVRMSDRYFWLRQEAMKRGLRWRRYIGHFLWDGDLGSEFEYGGGHGSWLRPQPQPQLRPELRSESQPQPQPQLQSRVEVRKLLCGDKFTYSGEEYIKLYLWGEIRRGLIALGHTPKDGYFDGGHVRELRCAVANLRSGLTYLLPAYTTVVRTPDSVSGGL